MPFDVEQKYIREMEQKLNLRFPPEFHAGMSKLNGGTIDDWELYPVTDTSSRTRLKRTCNDILVETNEAKNWAGFPPDAIALAGNGCGDQAVVLANRTAGIVDGPVFEWSHETGDLTIIAPDLAAWLNSRKPA